MITLKIEITDYFETSEGLPTYKITWFYVQENGNIITDHLENLSSRFGIA
jgi:hypothetical protein